MKKVLKLFIAILFILNLVSCKESDSYSKPDYSSLKADEKYVLVKEIFEDVLPYEIYDNNHKLIKKRKSKFISMSYEYDNKGRVIKKMRIPFYIPNPEETKPELAYECTYNEIGKISYENDVDSGNITKYEYDNKGRLIKEINDYDDKKIFKGSRIFHYEYRDDDSLKIEKIEVDGKIIRETYYDEKKYPTNIIISSRGEREETKFERTYYPNGNRKKQIETNKYEKKVTLFNENDKYTSYKVYIGDKLDELDTWFEQGYDKNNNKTKFVSYKNYNGEWKIDDWEECKYDDNGNKLLYKKSNTWEEYKYDDKGNLIYQTNKRSNGKLISTFEYVYDEKNNLSSETIKDKDGEIASKTIYIYKKIKIEV